MCIQPMNIRTSKETPEWSGGGEILIYLLIKEIKSSIFFLRNYRVFFS